MNAAGRLGAYAGGLAVVFTAAFAASGALVSEGTVAAGCRARMAHQVSTPLISTAADPEESPAPFSSSETTRTGSSVRAVAMEQGGYLLQGISAPEFLEQAGELSFTITGPDGRPVTAFETKHEYRLSILTPDNAAPLAATAA